VSNDAPAPGRLGIADCAWRLVTGGNGDSPAPGASRQRTGGFTCALPVCPPPRSDRRLMRRPHVHRQSASFG